MPQERDEFGGIIVSDAPGQPEHDEFGGIIVPDGQQGREKPDFATTFPDPHDTNPQIPRELQEPSDAEAAAMFGQKQQGFFRGAGKGFMHPFKATAKGAGLPLLEGISPLSDETLKDDLIRANQEAKGGLLPPTKAGQVGEVLGGLAGAITQAGLTHIATAPGGPVAQKGALAATFGTATAYDEFIRAGSNALKEGKTPDEALEIAKTSARVAAPLGAGLGILTPPGGGSGLRKALTASAVLGGAGAALPLAENIVQKAQGLETPLTENVLESGATMAAVPTGLYALGKGLQFVPKAIAALRGTPGAKPEGAATPKAPAVRKAPGIVETESFVEGQPVEIIEANPQKGVALVRLPDGRTMTVSAEALETRRKGESAIPEQEATEPVRGVPGQPGQGQGKVPTQKGGQRVSQRDVRGETETAGSEVSLKLQQQTLAVAEQLAAAKARGAPAETQMDLEMRLLDLQERAEATLNVDDLGRLDASLRRAEKGVTTPKPAAEPAPAPKAKQKPFVDPEEQAAMDAAIREANEEGLPADVIYDEPTDPDAPYAGGNRQIGTTNAQGQTVLNPPELRAWLAQVPKERRGRAMKALLTEEGIHSLARKLFTDEQLAGVWRGLTKLERGLVNRAYTESWSGKPATRPEGFSEAQMGHEYLRRVMQRMLRGELTERAEGFGKFSQAAIDMVERVIAAVRRTVKRTSPELDAMVKRLEESIAERKAGREGPTTSVEGEAPAAFRRGKRPPPQDQDLLNLLPPVAGEAGATRAEMVRPITPTRLAEAIAANVQEPRPSFGDLMRDLKLDYPDIQPGQVKEVWRDSVWNKLLATPGKELAKLRDQLGLRDKVATGEIADPAATQEAPVAVRNPAVESLRVRAEAMAARAAELETAAKARRQSVGALTPMERMASEAEAQSASAKAANLRRDATALLARVPTEELRAPKASTERAAVPMGQQARANAIARIGEKLIREADVGEGRALGRKTVTAEDIGWWREKEGQEPALRRVRPEETRNLEQLGKVLTSGAAMDRTKRAGKRLPDTATKRLTVLLDNQTGEVHKVGTYRAKEGVFIVDPTAPGGEGTALGSLLGRKVGGKPRYKVVASVLLDQPVKGFRQKYPAWNRFREEFLDVAERDATRRQEGAGEATVLKGATEELSAERKKALGITEGPEHPGMMLAGDRLSRREATALLDHLHDEAMDVESLQDVRDAMSSLTQKAENKTLKGRDWQVINALRKEVLKTERLNPELKGTNEAIDKTIQRIFDQVQASKSGQDFANRLGAAAEPVSGSRAPEPAGGRDIALAEGQPEAAKATRAYHGRIARHSKFPGQEQRVYEARQRDPNAFTDVDVVPRDAAPESFRRVARVAGGPVRAAGDIARFYSEWMTPRLRRVGGQLTRLYSRQFDRAIDREKELYGDLTQWLDPAKRAAGAAFDQKTHNWISKLRNVTSRTAVNNFTEAVEGKVRAPTYAQRAVSLWQQANFHIGELLEPVIPGFVAGGGVQRNLTPFGYDVILRGEGKVWTDWVEGMAQATGRSIPDTEQFFLRWKEALGEAAVDPSKADKIAQDFNRQFADIVTHVKVDGPFGNTHWEALVHSTPFSYLEAAARRATHMRAFREEFPVNPASGRNPGWQRAYQRIKAEIPGSYHQDLDGLARALNGHPTDSYSTFFNGMLSPDSRWGSTFRRIDQTVGNLMAKAILTAQIPTQIPETVVGATPIFLGAKNYVRALAQVKQLWGQMEQQGQVNRLIYDWAFDPKDPTRSAAKLLGNAISKGSAQNVLNEFQEAMAAATARVVSERIQAGAITPWEGRMLGQTFRAMQFTKPQITEMLAGRAPELMAQFERKAASWLTSGNKAIPEGSKLGASRLFNSLFRFQSYPMMKMNQLRRAVGQAVETFKDPSATSEEKAAGIVLALKFGGGTVAQGMAAVAVTSLFQNAIFGTTVAANEAKDEPGKFMAESFMAAMGGPLYLVWRGARRSGIRGIGEQAARTFFPYSVWTSLSDAIWGEGSYGDKDATDRIGMFLERRVPGTRMIGTGLAMFGLSGPAALGLDTRDDKLSTSLRAFYRWRGEELGWTETERHLRVDTQEEFRTQMGKAVMALQKGDREGYREALRAAAVGHREAKRAGSKSRGASTEVIAKSFRARRVLEDAEGRKLDSKELKALRARIGEDAFRQLRHWDRMLEAAADGIQLQPLP